MADPDPSKKAAPTETLRLSPHIQASLRCPACRSPLAARPPGFQCESASCGRAFPVVDGTPVLIADERSVFAVSDYESHAETTFRQQSGAARLVSRVLPELGANFVAKRNYEAFAEMLRPCERSRVLVVGSGEAGRGMDALLSAEFAEIVNTDVSLAARPELICDSHDLPFDDETFDAVVIQAVLEHVADPPRCVQEVHRVLRPGAAIYAETPFIQQVHGGAYDFTRYTHLGHRRLFRCFDEVQSGAVAGSGTALAWSYQYFLLSFVRSEKLRLVAKAFARSTAFWLKYFDYFLLDSPGTLDAASGYYFMGHKTTSPLSDRDLIDQYRGAGAPLPMGSQ